MTSGDVGVAPPSMRAMRRQLDQLLPGGTAVTPGGSLETSRLLDAEPPRVAAAAVIEGTVMKGRQVDGDPLVGFAAFLDGAQESHIVSYVAGMPLVAGSVGAVVRTRRERRFFTWRSTGAVAVYAPLDALPAEARTSLGALGDLVRDTSDAVGAGGADGPPHPFIVSDAAVHAVQRDRERLERALAIDWCVSEGAPLCIDGGIAGDPGVAGSPLAVGVVKSHRVLYGGAAAFRVILALSHGQRSTVMRIESGHAKRSAVASWYLRVRETAGRDPLWGLVRVEITLGAPQTTDVGARADLVSRWILAESAPLALPDSRWDKMTYGIRDCEEFLRATRA